MGGLASHPLIEYNSNPSLRTVIVSITLQFNEYLDCQLTT